MVEMPKNRMISGAKEGVDFSQCSCSAAYTADRSPAMDAVTEIRNLSNRYSLLMERYTVTIMPVNAASTRESKKTGKENPKYRSSLYPPQAESAIAPNSCNVRLPYFR